MKRWHECELCGGEASVHCVADAAYLCWPCDARVHGANFLVSRHLRTVACSSCGSGAGWISGPGSSSSPTGSLCDSCCADDFSSSAADSASSSSCLSTAESSATKPARTSSHLGHATRKENFSASHHASAKGVLAGWCSGLGLSYGRRCVEMAVHALGAFRKGVTAMPLKVALAAALWHAIKECEVGEEEKKKKKSRNGATSMLRKLEARSRVPARLIVLAESRLASASRRRVLACEEGWAECK